MSRRAEVCGVRIDDGTNEGRRCLSSEARMPMPGDATWTERVHTCVCTYRDVHARIPTCPRTRMPFVCVPSMPGRSHAKGCTARVQCSKGSSEIGSPSAVGTSCSRLQWKWLMDHPGASCAVLLKDRGACIKFSQYLPTLGRVQHISVLRTQWSNEINKGLARRDRGRPLPRVSPDTGQLHVEAALVR